MKTLGKTQQGFTQIEVMIAVAISAILMVAVAAALGQFSSQTKRLSDKVGRDIDAGKAGQALVAVIESAGIAAQFEHLPVKLDASCDVAQPCVRELTSSNNFVAADASALGLTPSPETIEFFRDHDGGASSNFLTRTPAFEADDVVEIQGSENLKLSDSVFQRNFYTTWPLIDESSPPLVVLRKSKSDDYFSFNPSFALTTPPATAQYTFFFGSRGGMNLDQIRGNILLIYNADSPKHFTFQLVQDVKDCSETTSPGGPSVCLPEANAYRPQVNYDWTQEPYRSELLKTYAFQLVPVDTDINFESDFIPSSGKLGFTPSYWLNQTPGFFLFPTRVFSLSGDSVFDPSIDIRKVAYYFSHTRNGQIMAVAVTISSYFLKYDERQKAFSLMANTYRYGGNSLLKLVDVLPGSIVFARKLGSQDVSIFLYQGGRSVAGE